MVFDDERDAYREVSLEVPELDFAFALVLLPAPLDVGELEPHFFARQVLMRLAPHELAPRILDDAKPGRRSEEPAHEVADAFFPSKLQRPALCGGVTPGHLAGRYNRPVGQLHVRSVGDRFPGQGVTLPTEALSFAAVPFPAATHEAGDQRDRGQSNAKQGDGNEDCEGVSVHLPAG